MPIKTVSQTLHKLFFIDDIPDEKWLLDSSCSVTIVSEPVSATVTVCSNVIFDASTFEVCFSETSKVELDSSITFVVVSDWLLDGFSSSAAEPTE